MDKILPQGLRSILLVSVAPSLAQYCQRVLFTYVVLEMSMPVVIKHQKWLAAMLAADETSYCQ